MDRIKNTIKKTKFFTQHIRKGERKTFFNIFNKSSTILLTSTTIFFVFLTIDETIALHNEKVLEIIEWFYIPAFFVMVAAILSFLINIVSKFFYTKYFCKTTREELKIRKSFVRDMTILGLELVIYLAITTVVGNIMQDEKEMAEVLEQEPDKFCSRTENYETSAMFNDAFDIVTEIVSRYPSLEPVDTIIPCIHIKTIDFSEDGIDNVELSFDDKNAKKDFLPLYVDKDFDNSDPDITAALISHELYLAYQYANAQDNPDNKLSCLDMITEAFFYQTKFLMSHEDLRLKVNEYENENIDRLMSESEEPTTNMDILALRNMASQAAMVRCIMIIEQNEELTEEDDLAPCANYELRNYFENYVYGTDAYRKQCRNR